MKDELAILKEKYERLSLLYQVGQVIHSSLDPEEALNLIVREAVRLVQGSSGSIILVNPHTRFLEIQSSIGLPKSASQLRLKVGEGITGWVARHGKAARINDVQNDPRYVMVQGDVRSELAVPLEVNGEVRGVLNVDSQCLEAFNDSHQELLEALAKEASRVIQNTWVFEQSRLKARLLETLVNVGQVINSSLNLDEVLQVITRAACQLMNAKMSSLLLLDDTGEWLDLRSHYGATERYIRKPRLAVEESLLGVVVRRRKPIQVENVQLSGRYQSVEVARIEGLISLLSVPLVFSGESIGTLNVYTVEQYQFSNEEIRILSALADLSALAIEKARLYERVVDVEEELRQNEKLSALGLLAAEVAHEIRNPLTVLKMLYHSLDLKFESNDPRSRDAQIMGEKMDHLNKIVEQVLDFARSTEPVLMPVQLNEVVDNLSLLVRHKLSHQKISLQLRLEKNLPCIRGDGPQLEQAILNLLLNAMEAMPEGGLMDIQTASDKNGVLFQICDTGVGMTEEQQKKIFSSLLQTTKKKGTGIGLAIVKRVMDTHQAEVVVTSTPGKGTKVELRFPLAI